MQLMAPEYTKELRRRWACQHNFGESFHEVETQLPLDVNLAGVVLYASLEAHEQCVVAY